MTTIFDTTVLQRVVQNLKRPSTFFLDRWFGTVATSQDEFVAVDIVSGKRRVTPLVSPLVEGQVVDSLGITTNIFEPAYAKDKRRFDPKKALRRAVGEVIGGAMSPGEREQAQINFELADQIEMLTRRNHLMCIDGLLDGKLTLDILGKGTVEIDFGRDAANTVALVGGAAWGQAGVLPTDDIESWITTILKNSGAVVEDIVFTTGSWAEFKKDPNLKDAIETRRGGGSQVELGAEIIPGAVFKGTWGTYNLWLFNDWYIDPAGAEQPMVPDNTVLLGGSMVEGVQHFGAILDPDLGFAAEAFVPKSWVSKDPAVRWLMMQSAPLMAPHRINATFAATVK